MGVIIMKKFAMGIVIGAVLAFSASTYADEIAQLVGKQVDNEYPVVLNGLELNNKAPSIDGTSYAPVREISEKLGLNVKFENDTVILSKPEVNNMAVTGSEPSKKEQINNITIRIDGITSTIYNLRRSNDVAKSIIDTATKERKETIDNYKKKIDENNARIIELEQQKADLEKQKAELLK
jgi:hypothetical protein